MIALLPLLLATPVFVIARAHKHLPLRAIAASLVFAWALGGLLSMLLLDEFVYLASWCVWAGLFCYLASLRGEDDGWDPWQQFPSGPYSPKRKGSRTF